MDERLLAEIEWHAREALRTRTLNDLDEVCGQSVPFLAAEIRRLQDRLRLVELSRGVPSALVGLD